MAEPVNFETTDLPADVDAALRRTLTEVVQDGDRIEAPEGSRGSSREKLYYTTGMANPLARIGANPKRPLNLVGAIARFVWMVGASDRLEDIAYYEDKVRAFSDNAISVPGSSYGRRIFESSAGLNQITGAVERLRGDATSRRSAVVVWDPNDAVRDSVDIPCTFGFFYHIRDERLTAATIMRSNNALILLPYNFFEFSLLAEVVAAGVGVPLGSYVHWAASMHVYEATLGAASDVVDSHGVRSVEMPPIPRSDKDSPSYVLEQVRRLAVLEPRLRNAATRDDFLEVMANTRAEGGDMWLTDYWRALLHVLAAWGAAKRGWWDLADQQMQCLPDYLKSAREKVTSTHARPGDASDEDNESDDDQGALFKLSEEIPFSGSHEQVYATGVEGAGPSEFQMQLEAACLDWAQRKDENVTIEEMQEVRSHALSAYDLAARSQPQGGSTEDRANLEDETISQIIYAARRRVRKN